MVYLYSVLAAAAGYLLGSANSSLIVGSFYRVDVRKHGSGNAGMTNTLRTLGKTAALLVLLGDILKGILACLIGSLVVGPVGAMASGLGAVLGHNWPVYFGFKGGKGALTSIAVIFYLDWRLGLVVMGIFILVVAVCRYVSLGSICGAVVFPVCALLLERQLEFVLFSTLIAIIVIGRHRSNIGRILKGTESKLSLKKLKP